jgi:ketosteroid isomerase-like protein
MAMKSLVLLGSIALFGFATVAGAAGAATPESQIAATVKAVIDNFNKGDIKAVAAMMSPDGQSIVDEIPPFSWSGANAFDAWSKSLADYEKTNEVSDDAITVRGRVRVVVSGDRAYVVQPVVFDFKQKGAAMQESSRMVYTLQQGKSGWLVTGFSWAGTAAKPVADAAKK